MATKLRAKPPEEVKPGKAKLCVFSLEGGGKTWFALQFPRAYVIDTEGGARLQHYMARLKASGGSYVGPDDGACDFDFIINEVKTLATEKHHYQTLVIDSITKVYQSTIAREAERLGDKDAFGASKKPAIAKMRQLIAWVSKLDMNVVFVAHQIAVWGGEGKDRKQVGVGPDAWEKLAALELDLDREVEAQDLIGRRMIVRIRHKESEEYGMQAQIAKAWPVSKPPQEWKDANPEPGSPDLFDGNDEHDKPLPQDKSKDAPVALDENGQPLPF